MAPRLRGIKQQKKSIAEPQDDFSCFIPRSLGAMYEFNLSKLVYYKTGKGLDDNY